MSYEFKSSLGDRWQVEDEYVKSAQTGRYFYLSDPLLRILEGSQSAQGADEKAVKIEQRMSQRLREIDGSQKTPDGKSFLIVDRSMNGGRWSHPVQSGNPQFDWVERSKTQGTLFVYTDKPEMAIRSHVGNPEMNLESPGSGDDVFNVLRYSPDHGDYGIVAQASSFGEAEEMAMTQSLQEMEPLPPLSYDKSAFVHLPAGELAGHRDAFAEVQLVSQAEDGLRHQMCKMHVMDRFSRCMASGIFELNDVLDMRNDPKAFEQVLLNHPHVDEGHVLQQFKNAETAHAVDSHDLYDQINRLGPNKILKFETPDEAHQILISFDLVDTYRENLTAKRLHTGPGAPSEEVLRASDSVYINIATERSYTIQVKRTEGTMVTKLSNMHLSVLNLFNLINGEENHSPEEMVEAAKLQKIKFADNQRSGDAPSFTQLLGASLQAKIFEIHYETSKHVKRHVLLNAMEAERQPKVESSLAMS
jgi:hypothetical protein